MSYLIDAWREDGIPRVRDAETGMCGCAGARQCHRGSRDCGVLLWMLALVASAARSVALALVLCGGRNRRSSLGRIVALPFVPRQVMKLFFIFR